MRASQAPRFSLSDTRNSGGFGFVCLWPRSARARSAGVDRALVGPQCDAEAVRRGRATRRSRWAFERMRDLGGRICRLTLFQNIFSGRQSFQRWQTTKFFSKSGACLRKKQLQAGSGRSPDRFLASRFRFWVFLVPFVLHSCSVWSRPHGCREEVVGALVRMSA